MEKNVSNPFPQIGSFEVILLLMSKAILYFLLRFLISILVFEILIIFSMAIFSSY